MKKISSFIHFLMLIIYMQPGMSAPVQKFQPLSQEEKKSACQAAISIMMPGAGTACDGASLASKRIKKSLQNSIDINALDNVELLLIERRLSDKSTQSQYAIRKADVYTYNYLSDTLTHNIINLSNGNIIHSENVQNVQLPLTKNEVTRLKSIVNADSLLRDDIEKEYLKITGNKLKSFNQLEYKAFIFLAKSMPGQLNQAAQTCGLHRCARLLLHTSDRIALETAPIIDLSTGAVAQRKTEEQ